MSKTNIKIEYDYPLPIFKAGDLVVSKHGRIVVINSVFNDRFSGTTIYYPLANSIEQTGFGYFTEAYFTKDYNLFKGTITIKSE